jgi:phosphatidylglycerophosphate synthase
VLSAAEKRLLNWLAARMPAAVNPDHLTALGLLSLAASGAGYWWARSNPLGLAAAILGLALNWFGDSLDGTLARVRNRQRPRYGFYVDHVVDCFGALFLLGGLALSGFMSAPVAAGLLIGFLFLAIDSYLTTYTLGRFELSHWKMGPTELRILLAAGTVALYWKPRVAFLGRSYSLFDFGGAIGVAVMTLMTLVSVARHGRELFRLETRP